jgi:hypothetical protein
MKAQYLRAASLALSLSLAAAVGSADCYDRCFDSGRCCVGNGSACAMPSCVMGCSIGSVAPDEATCNATCSAAYGKCSYSYNGYSFGMCGGCPLRWLDPATLTTEVLPGNYPIWPPGFNVGGCTSCGDVHDECMVGCVMQFNPSYAPGPAPPPNAPPDTPFPPAPWPNAAGSGFNFSVVFSDHAVLQQAPAMAAVFGPTGTSGSAAVVSVTVTPSSGSPYTVPATVVDGRWKAFLNPTPDDAGATTFTITATCASGCNGTTVELNDIVFGDVWYCAGRKLAFLRSLPSVPDLFQPLPLQPAVRFLPCRIQHGQEFSSDVWWPRFARGH